jgi:hypothetical protein
MNGFSSEPESANGHIAEPNIATSDMAVEAAKVVLERRGIDATELNAIIVCTVTPDMMFPSTACLVQHRIGAKGRVGVRPDRRLLRLRFRPDHRRSPGAIGIPQEGPCDRSGHHVPHHRLQGPRHLCPVR